MFSVQRIRLQPKKRALVEEKVRALCLSLHEENEHIQGVAEFNIVETRPVE
jgi:hypothetical protein